MGCLIRKLTQSCCKINFWEKVENRSFGPSVSAGGRECWSTLLHVGLQNVRSAWCFQVLPRFVAERFSQLLATPKQSHNATAVDDAGCVEVSFACSTIPHEAIHANRIKGHF
jgi:hypothetical protein